VADWQCLEELDADDDIVARYTYAPGYIDAVAVQERDLNADNDFANDHEVVIFAPWNSTFTLLSNASLSWPFPASPIGYSRFESAKRARNAL